MQKVTLQVYQYVTPKDRAEEGARWIAAKTQEQADREARRRKWKPCGGLIMPRQRAYPADFKIIGCDVVLQ